MNTWQKNVSKCIEHCREPTSPNNHLPKHSVRTTSGRWTSLQFNVFFEGRFQNVRFEHIVVCAQGNRWTRGGLIFIS